MSHQHKGNYSTKHPLGTQVADHITQALRPRIRKGQITCADAHTLAQKINVSPQQVGIAIDLYGARIVACQLGLFGTPSAIKTGSPVAPSPEGLGETILAACKDNAITCQRAWQIAQEQDATRLQVGQTCNAVEVSIIRCQLGTF